MVFPLTRHRPRGPSAATSGPAELPADSGTLLPRQWGENRDGWRERWKVVPHWQADHIIPVAEGGGLCGIDGYRSLCTACHRRETTALAMRLADKRRLERADKMPNLFRKDSIMLQWTETDQGRCFFADSAYKPVVDGEPKDLIWQLDLSTDDDPAWVVFESSPELLDGLVDVFRPGVMEWKSIDEAKAYCQGRESLLLAEAGK